MHVARGRELRNERKDGNAPLLKGFHGLRDERMNSGDDADRVALLAEREHPRCDVPKLYVRAA